MTKVFKLFEEDKQEAVNIAKKETMEEMAVKLIKLGLDNAEIMMVTGLTRDDLDLFRKELQKRIQYRNKAAISGRLIKYVTFAK